VPVLSVARKLYAGALAARACPEAAANQRDRGEKAQRKNRKHKPTHFCAYILTRSFLRVHNKNSFFGINPPSVILALYSMSLYNSIVYSHFIRLRIICQAFLTFFFKLFQNIFLGNPRRRHIAGGAATPFALIPFFNIPRKPRLTHRRTTKKTKRQALFFNA
jgi:hypothetical protein